jgi:bifunctional aspartokinase / homoserine dehydrogenase 1
MGFRIMKFGGTSLGSAEAISAVRSIVQSALQESGNVIVVVSAMSGVTDQLIECCQTAASGNLDYKYQLSTLKARHIAVIDYFLDGESKERATSGIEQLFKELEALQQGVFLVREASKRTLDLAMSFGERLSTVQLTELLSDHGAVAIDSRDILISDSEFGNAKLVPDISKKKISEFFKNSTFKLHILPGFIASTASGETTTLGRGGSDLTAAALGAALGAKEIEIWTDVDGVMTADPRRVKKAFVLPKMSYKEAMELCHFGARVIYPPTMQPAMDAGIPIKVRNTFRPELPGTIIAACASSSDSAVTGVSSISLISLLRVEGSGMIGISGISGRLFLALAREKINVVLISQASSEHSICLAVAPGYAQRAKRAIESEFALEIQSHMLEKVEVENDLSVIAVVGENMRNTPGISGRLFQALGKNGVNVVAIAQGSSELNISVVVSTANEAKALNALHDAFFLAGTKTINLFLVGVGLVGKALLAQLDSQLDNLRNTPQLELRLIGVANSRKMLINSNDIEFDSAATTLAEHGNPCSMREFIDKMVALNLPNSIFVDCTASEQVASYYLEILARAISIVTPNKKANSGQLERYSSLQSAAAKANVKFFYETNVGAGLPVIGTLRDLLTSGDEIIRIEAVLSGTLSYIFNCFDGLKPFSEIVREAKAKGYTEPDPRDDLSGRDVARKLLILCREMGLALEESDVSVESLVPESCRDAHSVEEFFRRLVLADNSFAKRLNCATSKGHVLRYIASIENGNAYVALKTVDSNHPFFLLSGSDNIISFTTKRYCERPLVVKGPGAGTDVTAAGVFADVIRVASYLS